MKKLTFIAALLAAHTVMADEWIGFENKSDKTDFEGYVALIESEHPEYGTLGLPTTPKLYVRCQENKTEMYVNWDMFMGGYDDQVKVETRFDGGKVSSSYWSESTDHKALFARQTIGKLRAWKNHDEVVMWAHPYGGNQKKATFKLGEGFRNEVAKVAKHCNWKF